MRVIVIRLSALGDIVHTWPLATSLKQAQPSLRLAWAVEEPLAPLVQGHPAVDEVITVATKRWRRRPWSSRTLHEIRRARHKFADFAAELCIDPQGLAKSAFMTLLSGAKRRVGLRRHWRRELLAGLAYTETLSVTEPNPHVIRTNLEFLRCVGAEPPNELPAPDGRWLLSAPPVVAAASPLAEPYALVFPAAGHPSKAIPPAVLAEVATELAQRGLRVLAGWGPGEQVLAQQVADRAGPGVTIAPRTTIVGLAQLAAGARLTIGGDTGPVHLAASLGTPAVSVFVATDPRRNRPIGDRVEVVSTVPKHHGGRAGSAWVGPGPSPRARDILAAVGRLNIF